MSIDQSSPLVPIKPQVSLQNSAFLKNSHNRSSFCGVSPSPTNGNGNGSFKTFSVNRKSWSGNVTLPLQQLSSPDFEQPPQLATFRAGTGTFPRNRERNNNGNIVSSGILTPNGNTVQTFKGNEVRRSGCSNGRRYAEIGNWSKRNASLLEPHLQGVRRRDSRSSDSEHDERSTEDDERSLLRRSPRVRLPPPPPPPEDPPPLKPREFFEKLQTQTMKDQDRKQRPKDLPLKETNRTLFRTLDAEGSIGDSLSQSRESLSSGEEGARGDCSSVDTSGSDSEEQPPCDIGVLERLIRTHPVWFLPGIQRAGAFHLLQGKEEGNFVVRQSSQPETMAISVRLPADKGPYIEHYLIQSSEGRIGLETSHNRFDNIPELIAHYSQCCDELPVQLQLPRPLRDAKSRHQLSSLALLGQEFWGYPMANSKNNPQTLFSPSQIVNGIVPMAVTPSDTGSSLSSFNTSVAAIPQQVLSPESEQNVILKMSPIDVSGSPPSQSNQNMSTFKGRIAPLPPAKPSGTFIRAPRPTPPNTLSLSSSTAHITQPHTFPTTETHHSPLQNNSAKLTPPPPPPRWTKPQSKGSLSPKHEHPFSPTNKVTQNGNITVTTTVTFSVNNTQIHNHQINESIQSDRLQLTLASNAINNNNNSSSMFNIMDATRTFDANGDAQNLMHRMSPDGECINAMTASLHGSFKRQMTEQNHVTDPSSPSDPQSLTNTSEITDLAPPNVSKCNNGFPLNQLVSPNGTNSVTSGIFSPTSQINSPVSNDTISSKSGVFSPMSQTNKSEIFSPVSRSSPISGKSLFSPTSIVSPLMGKDRDKLLSPCSNTTSTTPSGRSRRSKHSLKKESRHYQESDILESPGIYYRSSLMDKVSDYEDIWGPESNNCSTFKPQKGDDNTGNGIMKSKRPDLLPDTLPKLNNAKSTLSITKHENHHHINSNESLPDKLNLSNGSLKKSFNESTELIATTNSKGEIVAKRPDKLNISNNMNKKLTEEIESAFKNKESFNIESMETVKIEDNSMNDLIMDEPEKDNTGSPFYADPVDAIKDASLPPVQRRKLLRVGMSLAQRYSEPPTQNHPYYPLRDMHSIEELSPSSPNTSTSVDNLVSLRSKPKMKAVQPPRVNNKPPNGKTDPTWTVDSSWEFINKNTDEGSNSESGTFPSLAEQECRLSGVEDGPYHLSVHQIVAQRFPDLHLNPEPAALPEEVLSPPRASCYDNVHELRPLSEQASDDGTVFSEPWDSSQWDGLLPPNVQQPVDEDENYDWEGSLPRRGPAVSTRAKSFRDRLDPLLAAGRVRALRGSRTARGAGAALRAYALHLAQDKSTTFAQNVDNFIACTLDSKEVSPQVMMRNMRQFMSGMKNYLVKHGEREFEREVEKERLKLKPTEFLNLDAILEGVMHRLVVRPLRSRLYALLASWHAADVRQLHAAIERAHHATPLQLGVKESTKVPSSAVLAVISKHFLKMQEADSPLDKLENLLAAISVIFNSIRGERSLGADDLLPVLAWTVARCRLVCAELEAELMAGLLPAALLAGEGGYYLTALFSAVAVLKRLAPDPAPDSTAPWRRGSLESITSGGCAVVRVALPDECRGSIRRVALPCRPGARARDLCRALAHAAAITNPQDYALFALHDGQETMLNENDCPQEVMVEKNGQNFILAYKRIDAKIAWPQQALLSLP